jgi:hypothetical protein
MYIGKVHLAVGGRFKIRIAHCDRPKTPTPENSIIYDSHQCVSPSGFSMSGISVDSMALQGV